MFANNFVAKQTNFLFRCKEVLVPKINDAKRPVVDMRISSMTGSKNSSCFTGQWNRYVDPVFSVTQRFIDSSNPKKTNLGVGVYRDEKSRPYVFNVVRKVEKELADDPTQNKEYLFMSGLGSFVEGSLKQVFGSECEDLHTGLIGGVQSISGTGAVKLACDLLYKYHGVTRFYTPDPTWPIHNTILEYMGVTDIRRFRYYDNEKHQVAIEDMYNSLKAAPPHSCVILQACGNNPTGVDLTHEQWEAVASLLIERQLIPLIDLAYMGFVSGDIDQDSYLLRLLYSMGKEFLVCVSFAKNLGLYNERVGLLGWYANSLEVSQGIRDRLCYIIRNIYSNPPAHGAKVASKIMNDPTLCLEWKYELKTLSSRIEKMRNELLKKLKELKTPGDWSFITRQRGLFSYTEKHIEYIENKYAIFMLGTGRINVSALNEYNISYVAEAIHDAVISVSEE